MPLDGGPSVKAGVGFAGLVPPYQSSFFFSGFSTAFGMTELKLCITALALVCHQSCGQVAA